MALKKGLSKRRIQKLGQDIKAHQTSQSAADPPFENVFSFKMAQFMGQNGDHFGSVQGFNQRIEKDNAFVSTQPGKIGTAVTAANRSIHHEKAVAAKPGFVQQLANPLFDLSFLQWRKAVKERGNQARIGPKNSELKKGQKPPTVNPPVLPQLPHGPQQSGQQGKSDDGTDGKSLEQVEHKDFGSGFVKTEALL